MKDDGLIWKIAAGIVVGAIALATLRSCQQQIAIRQFNESMSKIAEDSAAQSRRYQVEIARRNADRESQQAAKRQADLDAKQLLPGQRCIGKNLFARVDNGWEQVMDGSAALKCDR